MKHFRAAARWILAATLLALGFAAAGQAPAAPGLYLWEVHSLTNRVYLFGTIHAGKAGWFPLPAPIESALADSRVLVVEADITNAEAMAKSAATMVYAPPDALAKHVRADDYLRFRRLLGKYSLPEGQVAQLKPFMAASLLVFGEWGRLGYLPQHGIDSYIIARAKAEAKPILEIEGVAAQAALLGSLTEEENDLAFRGVLSAIESGLTSEQITGMVNAWQVGDPALLLEVARKYNNEVPGAEAFEEKFIWGRHDAMAKKIEGYLSESRERHFIAVGALHLAGPRGLVEMLRRRGYMVRQSGSSNEPAGVK